MESDTVGALSDPPPCRKCSKQLTKSDWSISRGTRKYFKNCKVCREKVTSQKRKSRNAQVETRKQAKISYSNNKQGGSNNSIKEEDVTVPEEDPASAVGEAAEESDESAAQEDDVEQWFDPPENQEPSERECSVCAESFPVHDFPSFCSCAHRPEVCQQCFLTYLNGKINDTVLEQIECPESECKSTITHDDVKIYAPSEVFKRFDELSFRSFLSNDPDFRFCYAQGCNFGQIHDAGQDGNIFRCGQCAFRVCTIHNVPFHTDETCEQYTERIEKEKREEKERIEKGEKRRERKS